MYIEGKTSKFAKREVLFFNDNMKSHRLLVAMTKLHDLAVKLILLSSHSPDLTPCKFSLYTKLIEIGMAHLAAVLCKAWDIFFSIGIVAQIINISTAWRSFCKRNFRNNHS